MLPEYKTKTNIAVGVGFLLHIFGTILSGSDAFFHEGWSQQHKLKEFLILDDFFHIY